MTNILYLFININIYIYLLDITKYKNFMIYIRLNPVKFI
jgi:hypothetical protein